MGTDDAEGTVRVCYYMLRCRAAERSIRGLHLAQTAISEDTVLEMVRL